MFGFGSYNYDHFTREVLAQAEAMPFNGPQPGERPPDFKAITLDGETVRLRDFQHRQNVVLMFGSATCPMTAGSIRGMNELYREIRGGETEFLFVYVREAHPGERIPAHKSMDRKIEAAKLLRDEEAVEMPILVDDPKGSIHRKYSQLPNPAFLIDKSGRVAFRCKWTTSKAIESALEELLRVQQERGVEHAVVRGGEDQSMPISYGLLYSYRALERGGVRSLHEFREALGLAGTLAVTTARVAESWIGIGHTRRLVAVSALTAAVLAGGLYAGFELRKRRLGMQGNPYRAYEKDEMSTLEPGADYGAVGI